MHVHATWRAREWAQRNALWLSGARGAVDLTEAVELGITVWHPTEGRGSARCTMMMDVEFLARVH